MTVQGECAPRFAAVREEFERNFAERGDVGASVCVTIDGDVLVDLWGGTADPATGEPWREDTVGVVWSCTKGMTALCAHILADRGKVDLDAPVAQYWPEFAQADKEAISVRMLLNHQAGMAALREPLSQGAFYDWEQITGMLAKQEPFWQPGTMHGYHAATFGHLVGEVVRRVSGRTLGQFFAEEVATPLGLDVWIGLPEAVEPRVAPNIGHDPPDAARPLPAAVLKSFTEPGSLQALVYHNNGGLLDPAECNTRRFRAAENPSMNGVANARALAGMYRPLALGGAFGGTRLVSEDAIAAMGAVASAGVDAFALVPTRFSLGFVKGIDNRRQALGDRESLLISEPAFGHIGFGGSLAFADPCARMTFAYTTNKQRAFQVLDERGQAIVDAIYRSIGYRLALSGVWYA